MIVHLYGRCAYTDKIEKFQKHNLKLIEDNAQAQGCCYVSEKVKGKSALQDQLEMLPVILFILGKILELLGMQGCDNQQ